MSAASVVTNWFRGKREEMRESEGEEMTHEEEEEEIVIKRDEKEEEEEQEEDLLDEVEEAKENCIIKKNEDINSVSLSCHQHNGGGSVWAKTAGTRAAVVGRLKTRLFETRLAAHVKQAHVAITDSLKQAGWAVEHKVSEVSRRGWSEATRAWGSGGSGGGTLALTGGSGGPHERSSLLLGPGDGYQRLDNNNKEGCQPSDGGLYPDLGTLATSQEDDDCLSLDAKAARNEGEKFECSDGWGDDAWSSDWGPNGNNSNASSPAQTRLDSLNPSPNARNAKKNNNNSTNKSKTSIKSKGNAEEELLVDLNGSSSTGPGNNKGHTWDNWDDDWEKVDGQ